MTKTNFRAKKLMALLLALVMVFALAACSSSGSESTDDESEEVTDVESEEESTEEETDEDEVEYINVTTEDINNLNLISIPSAIGIVVGTENFDLTDLPDYDEDAVINISVDDRDLDVETVGEYTIVYSITLDGQILGELLDGNVDGTVTYPVGVTAYVIEESDTDTWLSNHIDGALVMSDGSVDSNVTTETTNDTDVDDTTEADDEVEEPDVLENAETEGTEESEEYVEAAD